MKRILIITFCLVYLFSASGILLHLHYCGGRIQSISLLDKDEDNCCGDAEKKMPCCKDKEAFVKIEDNQTPANSLQLPGSKAVDLFLMPVADPLAEKVCTYIYRDLATAPPYSYKSPPYLRLRVLLI